MFQEIITYIILALTFSYFVYKTFKFFSDANKISKKSPCSGCSNGECNGCPIAGGGMKFENYSSNNFKKL